MVIDQAEKDLLLSLARRSIAEGLGQRSPLAPPRDRALPPTLLQPGASFVTLQRGGQLRGCRGLLEAVRPLAHDVWLNAWSSAYDDPRFPPVAAPELADLAVGVSLLSPLERIGSRTLEELIANLEPGRHGLVIALGPRRATFLPQVWGSLPEPERFISELRGKAGMPRDQWSPAMEAWRYTADALYDDN